MDKQDIQELYNSLDSIDTALFLSSVIEHDGEYYLKEITWNELFKDDLEND